MGRTRLVARNEMGLRSETGETGRETLKKASSPNLGNKDLGREVSVRQLELMLSAQRLQRVDPKRIKVCEGCCLDYSPQG